MRSAARSSTSCTAQVTVRRGLTLPLLALLAASPTAAQPQAAAADFTIDDVLDVRNASVGAVSSDGRWVVVTYGSLRDRIGTDNHRYGDPTYIAPSLSEVAVIDTRTGASRPLFEDRRHFEILQRWNLRVQLTQNDRIISPL